jgi:hypothetical protein
MLRKLRKNTRNDKSYAVFLSDARAFAESNGVIVKVGDTWHPNSVEVIACYSDWAERNERVLEQLNDTLKELLRPAAPKGLDSKNVGYRV